MSMTFNTTIVPDMGFIDTNDSAGTTGQVLQSDGLGHVVWNTEQRVLTQAEYDALPSSKTSDGVTYYISDGQGGGGEDYMGTIIKNGISYGASGYTLPTATTTTLGGVKPDGVTITVTSDGTISGSSSYVLPTATSSVLGGVKVGQNLTINDGILDATDTTYTPATTTTEGLMSSADKTKLDGVEAGANAYVLPTATSSLLGGVKPDGTSITVTSDGTISAAGGGGGGASSTDTTAKIFLVGATTQSSTPSTYSNSHVYAENGQLDATKLRISEKVTLEYSSENECINFVFN